MRSPAAARGRRISPNRAVPVNLHPMRRRAAAAEGSRERAAARRAGRYAVPMFTRKSKDAAGLANPADPLGRVTRGADTVAPTQGQGDAEAQHSAGGPQDRPSSAVVAERAEPPRPEAAAGAAADPRPGVRAAAGDAPRRRERARRRATVGRPADLPATTSTRAATCLACSCPVAIPVVLLGLFFPGKQGRAAVHQRRPVHLRARLDRSTAT